MDVILLTRLHHLAPQINRFNTIYRPVLVWTFILLIGWYLQFVRQLWVRHISYPKNIKNRMLSRMLLYLLFCHIGSEQLQGHDPQEPLFLAALCSEHVTTEKEHSSTPLFCVLFLQCMYPSDEVSRDGSNFTVYWDFGFCYSHDIRKPYLPFLHILQCLKTAISQFLQDFTGISQTLPINFYLWGWGQLRTW